LILTIICDYKMSSFLGATFAKNFISKNDISKSTFIDSISNNFNIDKKLIDKKLIEGVKKDIKINNGYISMFE